MKPKSPLEKKIQADIEAAIGAEPDLLLLRNSVGKARYVSDEGKEYFVPYGLGNGSPDLVGILKWKYAGYLVGRWFCLEVKQPGEVAEPAQAKCHAIWRSFGAFVAVVDSVDDALSALERARNGKDL